MPDSASRSLEHFGSPSMHTASYMSVQVDLLDLKQTNLLLEGETAKHNSSQPPLLTQGPPGGWRCGENTRTSLNTSTIVVMTVMFVPFCFSAL